MAASGSPDKGTAAAGEPGRKAVHGSTGAGEGQVKAVVSPLDGIASVSALALGFVKQYSDFMMGMLQGSLKLAQDYNAAFESNLREQVKADIEMVPRPKPAEPPPVKVSAAQVKVRKDAAIKPADTKPVKVADAGTKGLQAKTRQVSKPGKVVAKDDLKQISGIGPKLEKMLQDKGLYRFSDIASLTEDAARKLDTELGLDGRIFKDGWIEAARTLQPPKRKLRGAL
jgi:NADH-quinone oxidoreductase subunit E